MGSCVVLGGGLSMSNTVVVGVGRAGSRKRASTSSRPSKREADAKSSRATGSARRARSIIEILARPVLSGESSEEYDQLLEGIAEALDVRDAIDSIHAFHIANFLWEARRIRLALDKLHRGRVRDQIIAKRSELRDNYLLECVEHFLVSNGKEKYPELNALYIAVNFKRLYRGPVEEEMTKIRAMLLVNYEKMKEVVDEAKILADSIIAQPMMYPKFVARLDDVTGGYERALQAFERRRMALAKIRVLEATFLAPPAGPQEAGASEEVA